MGIFDIILAVIFSSLGFGILAFPAAFQHPPEHVQGKRVHIIVYMLLVFWSVVGSFLEIFPSLVRTSIIRLVGVAVLLGTGYACLEKEGINPLTSDVSQISAQQSAIDPESDPDYTPEYRARVAQEGPAYTQGVINVVQAARPELYFYSTKPLNIEVIDPKRWVYTKFQFEWALLNNTPQQVRIDQILANADESLNSTEKNQKESGIYEAKREALRKQFEPILLAAHHPAVSHPAAAQVQQQIAPAPNTAPVAPASVQQQPAVNVGTLEQAESNLALATEKWQKGDIAGAIAHAEEAYKIRAVHLGENHPKTIEVAKMIQTARGMQAGK
jgi:hypothetical protein